MPYHTVHNIQLYYEWHGPEDGPPVVFINGLLMDTTSWAFQTPAFAPEFRVLLYDCRGQGRSDKPPGPYSQAIHADDLRGLLDGLGVKQAMLVGLSNGGTVAMHFTSDHPDRVTRMVLIDTFAHTDPAMRWKLDSWVTAAEKGGPDLRFEVGTPWVWSRRFLTEHGALVASLRERSAQADPQAVLSLIRGTLEYDIRDRLPHITVPTLVLVGAEDILTPPWYAHELASTIPNARLIEVPLAGHALTIESPGTVNTLARAFLKDEL